MFVVLPPGTPHWFSRMWKKLKLIMIASEAGSAAGVSFGEV